MLITKTLIMKKLMQEKYLNPLTDFGFKKLFINELNKDLLIDFLNEIIQEPDRIRDIHYQPAQQLGIIEGDRKVIFDIFCMNDKGEYLIVEMQKAKQAYFRDRCIYYSTFPIQKQAPRGVWNFKLKAVYTVAILDFVLFDECEGDDLHFLEYVHLVRARTNTIYSGKLKFIFVELPKFNKATVELETNMDRWLFSLKNLSELDVRPPEVQGKIFEKLFNVAEIKKLTETEMEEYRKSVLEYQDVRDALDYAKEEARKEGLQEGRQEGRQEGKKEGRKEGRMEGMQDERVLIAKKCLQKGMTPDDIAEITGLTLDEVKLL